MTGSWKDVEIIKLSKAAREARNDIGFFVSETRVAMIRDDLTWEQGYELMRTHMLAIEERLTQVVGEEVG